MVTARISGSRKVLDALYRASSGLAALSLAAIAVLVLTQIGTRALGIRIIGLDDFAAWSMAAAVFLALPGTLARGGHIRVQLFVQALPARVSRSVDFLSAVIGLCVSVWAARSVINFVWTSYRLGDVTQGELVLPLWLPQLTIAIGFALLAVAFAEHAYDMAKRLFVADGVPSDSEETGNEGL